MRAVNVPAPGPGLFADGEAGAGPPLVFRPAGEDDHAYVIQTWLESYRDEQPEMRTRDYMDWMRSRLTGRVLLACHESQPVNIVGWIAADSPEPPMGRIHYAYVRRRYRRMGIARRLFEVASGGIVGGEVIVTHLTETGRAIKKSHPNVLRFVPL